MPAEQTRTPGKERRHRQPVLTAKRRHTQPAQAMQFKEPPPLPSRPAMSIVIHRTSMTTPPTPQQMSMAERLR